MPAVTTIKVVGNTIIQVQNLGSLGETKIADVGTIEKDNQGRVTAIRLTSPEWIDNAEFRDLLTRNPQSGVQGISGVNRDDVKTIIYAGSGGLAYDTNGKPQTITRGPDGKEIFTSIPGPSESMGDLDAQFKARNEADEARYQGILSGLDQQLADTNKSLATAGTQQRSDINQAYFGLGARGSQDLVSRGLSGTTIAPTMSAGIERSRIAEQNRLAESLTQQRLGYQNDILSQKYGVMERKSETFPNMALYNEIYKNLGNAGG